MTQEALIEALRELKRVGTESLPLNEIESGYNLAVEDCIREVMRYPTPDSEHALSLLRSVCTPLDHNLEIQPGCATHRCIQAFLGGERPSEDSWRAGPCPKCNLLTPSGWPHYCPSEIRDSKSDTGNALAQGDGGSDADQVLQNPDAGLSTRPSPRDCSECRQTARGFVYTCRPTEQPDECGAALDAFKTIRSCVETYLSPETARALTGRLERVEEYLSSPERELGLDPAAVLALLDDMVTEAMEFDSAAVQYRKVGRNNVLSQLKEKIAAMTADNTRRGRDD